jgi:hypothetical protein
MFRTAPLDLTLSLEMDREKGAYCKTLLIFIEQPLKMSEKILKIVFGNKEETDYKWRRK